MYRYRDIATARAPLHRRVLNLSKYSRFQGGGLSRARYIAGNRERGAIRCGEIP